MGNLRPGTQFNDRYTIVRRLGSGGMGEVYLAREISNPEFYVALKVIPPGVIDNPSARERFRNEIVAAYRINHPNIIKAYEYFEGRGLQAYAMEYVSGGDLLNRIKREPVAAEVAARYLTQIASALETIHAAGIVHRDLKPENILLTEDDQVKLADFGVARLRGSQTLTQAGGMVGTPRYIPPEYLETGESDHRGDIFALGVLGYEMLSGVSPFPDDSRELLIGRRGSLKPPPLVKVAPHCPPQLALIIERAMSPNLAQRYQSATHVREELERLSEEAPLYEAKSTPSRTVPADRLNRSSFTSSFSLSRIASGGAVVGLFAALIVVIARPSFFGATSPINTPPSFDFSIIENGRGATESLDPRELGLELVRISELEGLYEQTVKSRPLLSEPSVGVSMTPIGQRGPQILGEPGSISLVHVRERRLWLEKEIARLNTITADISGD